MLSVTCVFEKRLLPCLSTWPSPQFYCLTRGALSPSESPFLCRPQNPWYRWRQCTKAGIPASPIPGAWQGTARHHADPQWVWRATEHHWMCVHTMVPVAGEMTQNWKLRKGFFHRFYVSVMVFVSHVLTGVQKYTQLAFLLCSNPWCLTGPILNFGCFPIFTYGKITDDYSSEITEKSTCIHHFYEYRLQIVTLHAGGSPPSLWKCPPVMCCYWSH